mgnify:FL=1
MSDGISEGYRAASASKYFDQLWTDAQVDNILLDVKSKLDNMSVGDLMANLIKTCPHIVIKNYDQFAIPYKDIFLYSSSNYTNQQCALVRFYKLEISGNGIHRSFKGKDFVDTLKEATLFAEWIETDEGKVAVREYNDY